MREREREREMCKHESDRVNYDQSIDDDHHDRMTKFSAYIL